MKYFLLVIFVVMFDLLTCQVFYPDQFKQSSRSSRISAQKCQEYKDEVAEYFRTGGLCLVGSCPVRIIKRYVCNRSTGLIIGGTVTKPKEYPHMAAIGWKTQSIAFKCGGSLISDRFVMTVAHCAQDQGVPPNIVRLGDQNLMHSNDSAEPAEYSISNIIVHPNYEINYKENDIALIKLSKKVAFTKFIRPACLHQMSSIDGAVIATGWGKTSVHGQTSDELMKVSLNIVESSKCYESLETEIDASQILSSQICAGGTKNKDTCRGDSGGPIQRGHEDATCVFNIIGMTSYGVYACGSRLPSVYTRVNSYLDWIEKNVWL